MGNTNTTPKNTPRATKVTLVEYKWKTSADKDGVHSSLTTLVLRRREGHDQTLKDKIKVTGSRSSPHQHPKEWGGSVSSNT